MKNVLLTCLVSMCISQAVLLEAAEFDSVKAGTVKITTRVNGLTRTGTGFVVKLERDGAYIMTASHVIEGGDNTDVEFFTLRNSFYRAETREMQGGNPNGIAVLFVKHENLKGVKALQLDASVATPTGKKGAVIGFPLKTGLAWSVLPAKIIGQKGAELLFQGSVDEGNSGGPLIINNRVAGVVVASSEGDNALAVPALLAKFFLNGCNIELEQAEDNDENKEGGAWPSVQRDEWMNFSVSDVDYLPPIPDQVGAPDYFLIVKANSGEQLFYQEIFQGRAVKSATFKASLLSGVKSLTIALVEDDSGIFGTVQEKISEKVTIKRDQFTLSDRVTLPIAKSVFATYPSLDPDKNEISIRFGLNKVDPERFSGADAASATPLVPGRFTYDSVDFDAGDASDQVLIPAQNDKATAVFWALKTADKGIEAIGAKGQVNFIPLHEQSTDQGKEVLIVAERNDGEPMHLRIFADQPATAVQYRLFASPDSDKAKTYQAFLNSFLESEADPKMRSWKPANTGAAFKAMRKYFNFPIRESLLFLDASAATSSSPGNDIIMQILDGELAAYSQAVQEAKNTLKAIPPLVAVLLSEKKQPFSEQDMTSALSAKNDDFVLRAINAVGQGGRREYALKVLPRFLLSEKADHLTAARKILSAYGWRPDIN